MTFSKPWRPVHHFSRYSLLLLLSSSASGAVQSDITPSYGHDLWDVATGFPGGYVYSIEQTADGYLWIGTSQGLVRYDGLTFESARPSESRPEVPPPVLGLATDANGQLWGTDDHTHLFKFSSAGLAAPVPDNGKHQYLTALVSKTHDGWPLFASELQGVVEYADGTARVLLEPGLMPHSPTAVAQTADGTIWIGTAASGVFRLLLTPRGPEMQHSAAPTNLKVNCLLPIGDATVLVGTDRGLLSLQRDKVAEAHPELGNLEILALANGLGGDLWIGSYGRVFKAYAKDIDRLGKIRTLNHWNVHGTVTALFEDRAGDLWVGGPEVVERYRTSGFATYSSSAGMPCSNCGAMYVDELDRIWFAPSDGGLFVLSHGSVRAIDSDGLKDDTIYAITGGGEDEVWVARKYGGLTRLHLQGDARRAVTYTRRDGLARDSIYAVYRAPDDSIWAGTLGGGLSHFRNGNWKTLDTRDGLPSDTISAITGNAAGEIFVGTPNGLAVLTNNHWDVYSAERGLPPGAIETLVWDHAGALWIGTAKGISFLQSGTMHVPLGAPDALYGDILGIAESNGWLWITTRDHVVRVSSAALLKQSLAEGDYREFGTTEGLLGAEGVKRSQSVVEDASGRMWFSLHQGISVLDPSAFGAPALPVTTRPDGILVDGRPLPTDREVRIPSGRHRLTFRYLGVEVANPDGVRYRYRLDNVDSAWSEPTALREIDYTNVPPGRFQFHVTARNPQGIWNGNEVTADLVIEAAYWQTAWFQITSVAVLALLALGLYRMRLAQLHRQFHVATEERIGERTRIARELHDTLLQSFHGLMFQFQAARNMLPRAPQNAMETLDEAIVSTENAIAEGRNAIQDLRPESVVQRDLAQLLTEAGHELAVNQDGKDQLPVFRVLLEGVPQTLSQALQDEIYRIAREVIRNAFRHAAASHIEVEIRYDPRRLRLRVRDDGKGIDPKLLQDSSRPGHWGLAGIRERAQRIGAELDFWSEAGAGTEVELTIPASIAYQARKESPRFRLFPKAGK